MTHKPAQASRRAPNASGTGRTMAGLILTLATAFVCVGHTAIPDRDSRISRSAARLDHPAIATMPRSPESAELQSYPPLVGDARTADPTAHDKTAVMPRDTNAKPAAGWETYIFDAIADPSFDDDGDGFFHRIKVRFDADTLLFSARVYARLFLSINGGPWNIYYTTPAFTIFGTSPDDDYEIVTDLLSGYPSGHYDVLIELHDADTNAWLTDFGPADSSAMSMLPLEDVQRDESLSPVRSQQSTSGGGALGPLMLFLIVATVMARRMTGLSGT